MYRTGDEIEHFNPQTDGFVDKSNKCLFALLRACNAIYNGLESEKSCCNIADSYTNFHFVLLLRFYCFEVTAEKKHTIVDSLCACNRPKNIITCLINSTFYSE